MRLLKVATPVNAAASFACSAGALVADGAQTVIGHDIQPRPGSMRSLLLTLEGSIHGRIPDILGDDRAERIETIKRFLAKASEEEMNDLLGLVTIAISELNEHR